MLSVEDEAAPVSFDNLSVSSMILLLGLETGLFIFFTFLTRAVWVSSDLAPMATPSLLRLLTLLLSALSVPLLSGTFRAVRTFSSISGNDNDGNLSSSPASEMEPDLSVEKVLLSVVDPSVGLTTVLTRVIRLLVPRRGGDDAL